MTKISLAIAAALLAAMTVAAPAQGPSYEGRGYGGPLYVGPNFQGGGQHSPPVYDKSGASKQRYKKKRTYEAVKSRKQHSKDAAEKTETAKSAPEKSPAADEAKIENSSITHANAKPKSPEVEKVVDTATSKIESENSTISSAALNTAKTASDESRPAAEIQAPQNVGCKKYFPTAGMTLSVPCD